MTEETEKQMLEDAARLLTEEEMAAVRALNIDKLNKSIEICADKILAANCWDKVLPFPQLNGSWKVVAASGKFSFLVLANGEIHQLLETEEQSYEYFESLFED